MVATELNEQELWQQFPEKHGAERAELLVNIARYAYQRGAGDEALAIIEAAQEIYRSLEEYVGAPLLAEIYEGIGHVLRRLNRNDEASESVEAAVGLLREDYSWQLPNLLKLHAHWSAEDGKWKKAAEYFAEAARLDEIEDNFLLLAEDLINLGSAHFEMEEFEKALEVWLRSLPLYKEYGDFEGLCLCYQRVAEAYAKLDRGIDAIAFAQKALDIAESSGCTVKIVDSLIVSGKARHAMGELDAAIDLLIRAKELNQSKGRPRWRQVIEGEEELALVYRTKGEISKAEEIESRMKTIREIWDS